MAKHAQTHGHTPQTLEFEPASLLDSILESAWRCSMPKPNRIDTAMAELALHQGHFFTPAEVWESGVFPAFVQSNADTIAKAPSLSIAEAAAELGAQFQSILELGYWLGLKEAMARDQQAQNNIRFVDDGLGLGGQD